jgi:CHAT domain-containing protein
VYAVLLDPMLALVVAREDVRLVLLGSDAQAKGPLEALANLDSSRDASSSLARLREIFVDPLALGPSVKEVLVSPEGPLSTLPWAALLERPVTLTPSGTTHVELLRDGRRRGDGVLALGDPDYEGLSEGSRAFYYRGKPVPRLPSTRREAESVGTVVLLGADANEESFARRLEDRKRWRAAHLACHAFVDPERTMLSALALSPSEKEDGFLTALEVLRMDIPADLAVLSACEAATGEVVRAEGVLGLMRAFMYAGPPRVLCSLWKVDDEATFALMEKFYELWSPGEKSGMRTAVALRAAQEHVRSQEKWRHPYYWAAWVLWGLPD